MVTRNSKRFLRNIVLCTATLYIVFTPIFSAQSLFVESKDIKVVDNYLSPQSKCLVIFDLDNTVFEAAQEKDLGDHQLAALINWGNANVGPANKEFVLRWALQQWFKAQETMTIKPVEEGAPAYICSLQEKGFGVMVLTARGWPTIERTFYFLKSLSLDFSLSAPLSTVRRLDKAAQREDETPQYIKGVLFCGGSQNKDWALKAVLDGSKEKKWDKIIFIDDKESNVRAVQKTVEQLGIDYVGIRYGYLDEKVRQFQLDQQTKDWALASLRKELQLNIVH